MKIPNVKLVPAETIDAQLLRDACQRVKYIPVKFRDGTPAGHVSDLRMKDGALVGDFFVNMKAQEAIIAKQEVYYNVDLVIQTSGGTQ